MGSKTGKLDQTFAEAKRLLYFAFSYPLVLIFLPILISFSSACGYRHAGLYPNQYNSVSVPIFENRTFYQGVEFDLGEAMVKEIELRTPYKVTNRGHADTELEGTILNIEQTQLSRHRSSGVPQQIEVRVVVDFQWKDLRSGETIRDRRGLTAVGRYVPTSGASETFQLAQHQAVENLAQSIVWQLAEGW